jgi:O-antigen/teichoic acid export membrane protein
MVTLLKRNIAASYAAQLYASLIGVVLVPLYVKYMGLEAYGLVGFYGMLQGWFMLLDMGLTPTMARETARFRANAGDAQSLRNLLRALEGIFIAVALLGATAMILGSGLIAGRWLKVQQLPLREVRHALMLIGGIAALRWVSELYRGVITGSERLVWLNGLNIAVATLRFVLVIPFFVYVGTSPTQFFSYQLLVAVLEVALLAAAAYRLLPRSHDFRRPSWSWQPIREVLRFSLAMAATSVIWVVSTQSDKLLLSKLVPLSIYGCFTLAVLVASGIMMISVPVSGPLMPRLVALNAAGDEGNLVGVYRGATQLVAVMVVPAALVLAFFSRDVLWAWTGDSAIARTAAPVLTLYALGNAVLALGAFPYYLQYAKGNLNLHLIGSSLFVAALLPSLIWATHRYGIIGAGYAWLGANVLFFALWVPQVHRKFVKGLQSSWLLHDLAPIVAVPCLCALLAFSWIRVPADRALAALLISSMGLVLVAIAAAASSFVRGIVAGWLRMLIRREAQ